MPPRLRSQYSLCSLRSLRQKQNGITAKNATTAKKEQPQNLSQSTPTYGPRRTTKLTDRYEGRMKEKPNGKSPSANGGSVQRFVRRYHSLSPVKTIGTLNRSLLIDECSEPPSCWPCALKTPATEMPPEIPPPVFSLMVTATSNSTKKAMLPSKVTNVASFFDSAAVAYGAILMFWFRAAATPCEICSNESRTKS